MSTPYFEKSESERRLDELVTAYLKAVEAGEKPNREEWLARHPDLAGELAAFLDGQDQVDQLARSLRSPTPITEPEAWEAPTLPPNEPAAHQSPSPTGGEGGVRGLGVVRYFGDYELLEELARGGMGVIYKARQVSLNRPVAIKMILAGQLASEADVHRFRTEAEAAANLDHPNIVPIYEVGEYEGQHYFSMKLIEGGSLTEWIKANLPSESPRVRKWKKIGYSPRFSPSSSVSILAKVARAVHHAHQRGILHRDLKPSNILIDANNEPHVTDFGLAKRIRADSKLTQSGAIVGTPSYMAPEQARSAKELTLAVDVYSLGAILYELLTGRPPFHAATPMDTLLQVTDQEPTAPRKLNPQLDRDLETICLKCLEKEPGRRYATAEDFADDLGRWLKGEPIQSRRYTPWNRGIKWVRRHPKNATVVALAGWLLLGVGGAGWWYWDTYHRVKVAYFRNAVKRWGVKEGVGQLSEEDARHAAVSYKFYRRAGRVEKVEVVNGSGSLTRGTYLGAYLENPFDSSEESRECRLEYHRDDQGNLTEEIAYDRNGRIVWTFHYTAQGPTRSTGHYTDQRGFPRARAGSGATYVEILWTEAGFEKEIHYLDRNGNRRPDNDKVYGYRQEVDSRGLPVLMTYLGTLDQPIRAPMKWVTARLTYDLEGNQTGEVFMDSDGQPTLHQDGYARVDRVFDRYGNMIEESYFGLDGRPTRCAGGYAKFISKYNERGNWVDRTFFDVEGQPTRSTHGYARSAQVHDEHGFVVEWSYFGPDGKPTRDNDGCARYTYAYDNRGNSIRVNFFGPDGKPTLCRQGYAALTNSYDDRGNKTEIAYYGLDGKPTLSQDGYAKAAYRYDERDQAIELAYTGPGGKQISAKVGWAKTLYTYDDRGNVVEERYFGADGQPTRHRDGYARLTRVYDDQGNEVETAIFAPSGKAMLDNTGIAKWVSVYDDAGNLLEISKFGVDEKLKLDTDGVARLKWAYDDLGNMIEQTNFGVDGKLRENFWGIAKITHRYDPQGNQFEDAYWGADAKLKWTRDGYARVTRQFDKAGNIVEEAYFVPDGRPGLYKEVYHRKTRLLDEGGNLLEEAYFGILGSPVPNEEGAAKVKKAYNDRNREIETAYFGAEGKLINNVFGYAKVQYEYDDRGRLTQEAFFGSDGRPIFTHRSAKCSRTYDDRGNVLEIAYSSVDGKPALAANEGCAKVTYSYNAHDQAVEIKYYGPNGQPILHQGGYSRVVRKYDEMGKHTDSTFFDTNYRPTNPGFIRDWLILAPIFLDEGIRGAKGLAKNQLPNEWQLQPKEGECVNLEGVKLRWKKYKAPDVFLNFNEALEHQVDNAASYAVCYVLAPNELSDLTLKVGSDYHAKIYLNGKEIYQFHGWRGAVMDQDAIPQVTLKKGVNVLVLKMVTVNRDWSACLRFFGKDGRTIQNLRISLTPP